MVKYASIIARFFASSVIVSGLSQKITSKKARGNRAWIGQKMDSVAAYKQLETVDASRLTAGFNFDQILCRFGLVFRNEYPTDVWRL